VNILVAPDSFKGSLTAVRAAEIIADAIAQCDPAARCILLPQADGGDGTADVLARATNAQLRSTRVVDPTGRTVEATWLALPDGRAVIESAACIGWRLLREDERHPLHLRSTGLGQLVRAAAGAGYSDIVIGLGGSATNDAGLGFAEGLGFRMEFSRDPGGGVLQALRGVTAVHPPEEPGDISITALVDVRNPLCGARGATAVYGPQKGVRPNQVEALDHAVVHFASVVCRDVRHVDTGAPGMGAAGGLGFACAAFCGAPLREGASFVRRMTGFSDALREADLVITGEGRIDAQTKEGKTIAGVIVEARESGIPVVAFTGDAAGVPDALADALGLAAIFPVLPPGMPVSEGMENAEALLTGAVREAWPRIARIRRSPHPGEAGISSAR